MKRVNPLTKIEKENLERHLVDVSLSLDRVNLDGDLDLKIKKVLEADEVKRMLPFFTTLYFKNLNIDRRNIDWAHGDILIFTSLYTFYLSRIFEMHFLNVSLHEGEYLKAKDFGQDAATLKEAITIAKIEKDTHKYIYVFLLQDEIIKNKFTSELETIFKNNLSNLILVVFTNGATEEKENKISVSGINFTLEKREEVAVVQDHKLNQKLNHFGFDVLVVDGSQVESCAEVVPYAKDLKKPAAILVSLN